MFFRRLTDRETQLARRVRANKRESIWGAQAYRLPAKALRFRRVSIWNLTVCDSSRT
jgi:hypothetical protein